MKSRAAPPRSGPTRTSSGAKRDAGEVEVRVDLAVGGDGTLQRHARRRAGRPGRAAPRRPRCGRAPRCGPPGGPGARPARCPPAPSPSTRTAPCARTDGIDVGLVAAPFSAAVRMTSPATTPGSQRARWASEPKRANGQRPQHQGGPQRHRRHRVALRLQQEAELHQPVAGAAVGLGDGEPQQVGAGQRLPQVAVDALVAGLDRGDALGVDQAREEPRRRPRRPPAARRSA